jgi:hypothetical protein
MAPARSATEAAIMLMPSGFTSLSGAKFMNNRMAVPTTAITAATVTGSKSARLFLLGARINPVVRSCSYLKLLAGAE